VPVAEKEDFAVDSINDHERVAETNLFSHTKRALIDHRFSAD